MVSLRERKKTKAKVLIQEQALRLFAKQGYGATTVEQIAEAAEVSASTFFRYFQTKEAAVLYDSLDPIIIEAIRQQPPELSVIRALREAIKTTFQELTEEKMKLEMERAELLRTIPSLRAAMMDEMVRNIDMLAVIVAERTNRKPDDIAVRNVAGAVIGVGMAAMLQANKRPKEIDSIMAFDDALAHLENGLEFC